MADVKADVRFVLHRNYPSKWAALNPILLDAEIGYEQGTGKFKIGNGVTRWLDLDYFISESELRLIVAAAVAEAGIGTGSIDLVAHIESETPHPVYDQGPSFLLLYQNAKV